MICDWSTREDFQYVALFFISLIRGQQWSRNLLLAKNEQTVSIIMIIADITCFLSLLFIDLWPNFLSLPFINLWPIVLSWLFIDLWPNVLSLLLIEFWFNVLSLLFIDLWPNVLFPEPKAKRNVILAMEYIEMHSCVNFVEYYEGVHEDLGLHHGTYLEYERAGSVYI